MNDYTCILIGDAHTRMGHNIVPYAYGTSHTRMGQYTHMGQNSNNLIGHYTVYIVVMFRCSYKFLAYIQVQPIIAQLINYLIMVCKYY